MKIIEITAVTLFAISGLTACEKKTEPAPVQSVSQIGTMAVIDLGEIDYAHVENVFMKRVKTADGVDCMIANRSGSITMSCDFSKKDSPVSTAQ